MTSTLKVNNIQNQCGQNIINENSNTITIGASGDTIALASGASQTGFGRTGTVDWDTTPKTTTFTAVSGDGFFCNTTSGGFTANLPAGVAGAIVSFADYAGTWATGNLTVSPNGTDKIGGVNADVILDTEGQSVTFVFADSTQGWINVQDSTSNERGNAFIQATGGTVTCSGNDRIHTFTGPGTFTVSTTAICAANNLVSYLVVGGGGSGGNGGGYGAGGGAGGFREVKSPSTPYTASPLDGYSTPGNRITVTATGFPITVGGGGAGVGPCYSSGGKGNDGNTSTFSTIVGAAGGGGGSGANPPGGAPTAPTYAPGKPGGSGGGAGGYGPGSQSGGTGNTPPVTPAQGTNGGASTSPGAGYSSAGGGGATAAGSAVTNPGSPGPPGGNGGNGGDTTISGTPTTYAGGGGGGGWCASGGSGGSGGGGTGSRNNGSPNAGDGSTNRGGGGGGGAKDFPVTTPSGLGGSGIVIIRYKVK